MTIRRSPRISGDASPFRGAWESDICNIMLKKAVLSFAMSEVLRTFAIITIVRSASQAGFYAKDAVSEDCLDI